MPTFNVVWEIQIDGKDPIDACKEALKIMQDKNSEALAFEVTPLSGDNTEDVFVDLLPLAIKQDKIDSIVKTVKKFGTITTADCEASSSPCLNSIGDHHELVERFLEEGVEVSVYINEMEVNTYNMPYENLSDEVLEEIFQLVGNYELIND
jgi:hypothetical protein